MLRTIEGPQNQLNLKRFSGWVGGCSEISLTLSGGGRGGGGDGSALDLHWFVRDHEKVRRAFYSALGAIVKEGMRLQRQLEQK